MWTEFYARFDRYKHNCKVPYNYIYIELPELEAITFFKQYFNYDPEVIDSHIGMEEFAIVPGEDSLNQTTGMERNCRALEGHNTVWLEKDEKVPKGQKLDIYYNESHVDENKYLTLDQFLQRKDVCVIYKENM